MKNIFFILLLFPAVSNAAYWYSVSQIGTNGVGGSFSEAVHDWCSNLVTGTCNGPISTTSTSTTQQTWTVNASGGGYSQTTVVAYRNFISNCSNLTNGLTHTWSDNTCHSTPEPPPCQSGADPKSIWKTLEELDEDPTAQSQANSCHYIATSIDTCWQKNDGIKGCFVTVAQSGFEYVPADGELPLADPAGNPIQDDLKTDTRQSTNETQLGDQTTETAPDGTVTETTEQTQTEVVNEGTVVWNDGNKIYTQSSTGGITVTEFVTTQVTNPDGSKTVTTTSNYIYTPPVKSTTEITKQPPASTTNTGTSGSPKSGSTTTTKTYNASGQQTGESTTSTGTNAGEGAGEDECTGPDCEPEEGSAAGQPEFDSGDGSWWESSYPDGLSGIWASKQAALNDTALHDWLDSWNFSSSGSVPQWTISINTGLVDFGSFDLEVPPYVWAFVGLCILLTALFTARKLIFGG